MGNHLIRWHEHEFQAMAKAALRHDPELKHAAPAALADPALWEILMHTLPATRRRVLQQHHYWRLAQHLHKTLAAPPTEAPVAREAVEETAESLALKKARAGQRAARPTPEGARIFWTEHEYKIFALALHVMNPGSDYLHSPDLAALTTSQMNIAAEVLPPERRRRFPALEVPRKHLLKIYARAVSEHDPLFFSDEAAPATATPPAAAAEPDELAEPAEPAEPAVQTPAVIDAPEGAKGDAVHVRWSEQEWLAIARELDRLYPIRRYHAHPDSLVGLTPADVHFAQRVLAHDRQRPRSGLVSLAQLRKGLQRGFVALAAEKVAAAEAAELAALVVPEPEPEPEPAPNPFEAAFAPMVALLADQVSSRVLADLRPLLVALASAASPPAVSAVTDKSTPLQPAEKSAMALYRQERRADVSAPRKIHLGIFGNRNTYRNDLEHEFPHLDFTCITSGKQIDSIRNCDKAFAMVKWMGHSNYHKLKRSVDKDHFVYVDGGLSELKRVITVFLNSGAITAKPDLKAA